jgi:hypothetical protein
MMRMKWEYLISRPELTETSAIESFMNDKGKEDWELVAVTRERLPTVDPMVEGFNTGLEQYTLFFKRPTQVPR